LSIGKRGVSVFLVEFSTLHGESCTSVHIIFWTYSLSLNSISLAILAYFDLGLFLYCLWYLSCETHIRALVKPTII